MMKYIKFLSPMLLLLASGCAGNKEKLRNVLVDENNQLSQHRSVNGLDFHMQYLPEKRGTEGELCFRLNIRKEKSSMEKMDTNGDLFNYGVDSLFMLVSGVDTISPIHAMRISNGNMNGVEYFVVFDKKALIEDRHCHFVFKDWLFSTRQIDFSVKPEAVAAADAINKSI